LTHVLVSVVSVDDDVDNTLCQFVIEYTLNYIVYITRVIVYSTNPEDSGKFFMILNKCLLIDNK